MEKILQTWLHHQLRMLSGSTHAVLLTGPPDEGPYTRTLVWPDDGRDCTALTRVAQAALTRKQAVIKTRGNEAENTSEPLDSLACPLFLEGQLFGVVAIEMAHRAQSLQGATVQQVQVGVKWLEVMIRLQGSMAKEQMVNLVELVAVALEHEEFKGAATEVATLLVERFSCRRVSLGFLRGNRLWVEALSRNSRIDQKSGLVRGIRDAMAESLDQGTTIVYPGEPDASVLVTRCHVRLAEAQQGAAICTLPLMKNGTVVGAMLLERVEDTPFSGEDVARCEQIGLLVGPVLETRRRDERPLPLKVLESFQRGATKLFGPRHFSLKLGVSLTVALLFCLFFARGMFCITCESVLEAEGCQAIVAPQQGYIAAAHARAGDLVREGDLLATLDEEELRLEQRKWQSQHAQLLKEYRKALAGFNRAEVAILKARRAQAEAQLSLVEQQLARTTLVAPFSGLIVSGDLSQSLGSPVSQGEELFEIASTDAYRVVLKIDDRDIGLVSLGQHGTLKLSGIPDKAISITIDRLTPVSTTREGRNYFRVEAAMETSSDLMRPGMKGVARVEIGREKLLWIWTRRLVEGARLFAWNRLP